MDPIGENYVPLYKQIERKILENIASGKYKKGDRIPTQQWFVEKYGVSRVTVRQAVNELKKRHILISQKGGGTYVDDRFAEQNGSDNFPVFTSNINRIGGFTTNLNKTGQSARSKILEMSIVECDKFLGEVLNLNIGALVVSLQRLRTVNDIPVSVEQSYINKALVPDLDFLNSFHDSTSLYEFIIKKGGVRFSHASENFYAVNAEAGFAELLGKAEGEPILSIKRRLFTTEKQIIEYCEIHCRTDIYKFSVDYISQ